MALSVRCLSAVVIFVFCFVGIMTQAEPVNTAEQTAGTENEPLLTIVSNDFAGPLRRMADDLAMALSNGVDLHVLPVFSAGGDQTATDALYLKAMDVAFVHSDLRAYVNRHEHHKHIEKHLRYIAKLYPKDIGIVAGKSITSIRDLAGKKVNFDHTTSSNLSTSAMIFDMLGIQVERVELSQALAIDKIKSGEIAATVIVDDTPNNMIATLRSEDELHLVRVEYTDELQDAYLPTAFTSDDYPDLIASGQSVDSVAVSVVMAMYYQSPDNARHARIARFVQAFFSKFEQFQEATYHPNWRSVSIAAPLRGWTRFEPAEMWLTKNGDPALGQDAMSNLRIAFNKFVERQVQSAGTSLTDAQELNLFKEFLGWKQNPEKANIQMQMTATDGTGKKIGTFNAGNIVIEVGGKPELALLLKPNLKSLPPGPHALHLHTNPNCGPGEKNGEMVAGLGAGGHLFLTREGKTYGSHLGDLPDLFVAADGTAREDIVASRLSMADLLDRSIMIHASGNDASPRLACGVIQ